MRKYRMPSHLTPSYTRKPFFCSIPLFLYSYTGYFYVSELDAASGFRIWLHSAVSIFRFSGHDLGV